MDSGATNRSRPPFRGALAARRDAKTPLREWARQHFRRRGRTLTPPEVELYDAVEADTPAIYDPEGPDDARTLPAAALEWLCTDPQAKARVGRQGIRIRGGRVTDPINLDWIDVAFPLNWKSCLLLKNLSLLDARVGGLFFGGTTIKGHLNADRSRIAGSVQLNNGFHSHGRVDFLQTNIGGSLNCRGGEFENLDGYALAADGADITGGVFLNADQNQRFQAKGQVRLLGVNIGGNLECSGGEFENPDGYALAVDGADITGNIFLNADQNQRFQAIGQVRLLGVNIGGDLNCRGGEFENPGGYALAADRADITGNIFLNADQNQRFQAKGQVRLLGVSIGGNLNCSGGEFEGGFSLQSARLGGWVFRNLYESKPNKDRAYRFLDLTAARVEVLVDDAAAYRRFGGLSLQGFTYQSFAGPSPTDAPTRLEHFIRRQSESLRANPQPYERLAAVLRRAGHRRDAEDVLIAYRQAERKARPRRRRALSWLHDKLLGYGYRWKRPLWWSIGFVLVSAMFFQGAYHREQIVAFNRLGHIGEGPYFDDVPGGDAPPDKPMVIDHRNSEWYPSFKAFIFAVDVYVPLVDLEQTKYWQPIANRSGWSRFATWLMRISIGLGWMFTTLFVGGLATMVRREGGDSSG